MKNDKEIEGKFGQFNRVLMSYIDFQQAHAIATIILEENLHDHYPKGQRIKLEALNSSMIIAYSRPFSGNRGVPDLPGRFIRNLSESEKETHDAILLDRNTVIAHSDYEAWNMRPYYEDVGGRHILVPLSHSVHSPFLREPTERIEKLAEKQMEACFEAREALEVELKPYIPVIQH